MAKQDTFYYEKSKLGDSPDVPLALVLGWAGSVDSNVSKYAKVYQSFGFHTIRFSPNTLTTLIQVEKHKNFAYKLLNLIIDTFKLLKSPIVVHTFSNAGLFIYRHMSEIIHSETKFNILKDNFKCLIMDSGPGWPESKSALIQNVSELIGNQISIPLLNYFVSILGFSVFMIRHRFFLGNNYFTLFFQDLVKDQFNIPILLFYSKQDRLLSYKDALNFMKDRHTHAPRLPLFTHEFKDTEHVSHFLKYPNEYVKRLEEHLHYCKVPIYKTISKL